jgi:HSP20 family molecular chaperone IbpA
MQHFFTQLDTLFRDLERGMSPRPTATTQLPNYPVSNAWLSEDTNVLNFEFALAGYAEKEISVVGGKNSLAIRAKKADKDTSPDTIYLHRGMSQKDIDFSVNIDDQFDIKKAKVNFEQGLLRIRIPKAKEAESVMLFG